MKMTERQPSLFHRKRGETRAYVIPFDDDVSGFTFEMRANDSYCPIITQVNAFSINGVIDPDDNQTVFFTPTAQDADLEPGDYYFQVRRVRISDGEISIVADGTILVGVSI